jgi:alpha-amylase
MDYSSKFVEGKGSFLPFLSLMLEVHQPIRLNRSFPNQHLKKIADGQPVTGDYFDKKLNEEVFRKVASKCYSPTFSILKDLIEASSDWERPFKVTFGLSGPFLEQAALYEPELVDMLRGLVRTGRAEILGNTYYHSLASLFPGNKTEFIEQVKMHTSFVRTMTGFQTRIFENTEFIYNDAIAGIVESLGFLGILTEGAESVLGWRSPNYLYSAAGSKNLKLLMRHYRLTDDVGFRFSQKSWVGYPLTADKYSNWLASTPGDMILLAMDIETFGEHHWSDTGIFEFLKALPSEIRSKPNLVWATPYDIISDLSTSGTLAVPEDKTISWADVEKDATAWIQNPLQKISFDRLANLQSYVQQINKKEVTDIWRLLQQSDHLYYMSTKSGGPGEVHSYFSPHSSAAEAFAVFDSVITDYEGRVGYQYSEIKKLGQKTEPEAKRPGDKTVSKR